MLPSGDVEITLRTEDRGNVAQLREPVVEGVDESDVGTCIVQIGLSKGPIKPEVVVH